MSRSLCLGLAASPRRGGNTSLLLDWFLDAARAAGADGRIIALSDLRLRPCQACGGCDKTGVCVLEGDMTEVYEAVKEARGVVLASPIHFGTLSSQAKLAIDRFQCFWTARHLLAKPWIREDEGRRGFLLTAGGMAGGERFARNAEAVARVFFSVLNLAYAGALHFSGVDEPGAIARNPDNRVKVTEAGRAFGASIVPD